MSLKTSSIIAFAPTLNPQRAKAFYRDVIGLPLVSEDPFALVFDANGTMLRIQKTPNHVPLPHTALGWSVKGVDDVIDGLHKRGARFERFEGMTQDARGIWCAPS